MDKRLAVFTVAAAACGALVTGLAGQGTSAELQLVTRSAEALGGRDRVMALKTLQIVGYGELAYFDGGGNITGDPSAPQKWQKALDYKRTIDLEHGRTRVQQRLKMDFVFASTVGQLGLNRTNETLDGDVAYNIGGGFLANSADRNGSATACRELRPHGSDESNSSPIRSRSSARRSIPRPNCRICESKATSSLWT